MIVGLDAYVEQVAAVADWLAERSDDVFAQPSVLDGWDLRTLVGHLVHMQRGLAQRLVDRSADPPAPAAEFVRRYRPAVEQITAATVAATADRCPAELIAELRDTGAVVAAGTDVAPKSVVLGGRGAITAQDWVTTRLIELVVHSDDLSRSCPSVEPVPLTRPALAIASRALAEFFAAQAPGRSVELRIPPFVAVQAVPGLRHTRGTPPNVVETDPLTWVRLATGRSAFADAVAAGVVRASGTRADLTAYLPVLS